MDFFLQNSFNNLLDHLEPQLISIFRANEHDSIAASSLTFFSSKPPPLLEAPSHISPHVFKYDPTKEHRKSKPHFRPLPSNLDNFQSHRVISCHFEAGPNFANDPATAKKKILKI